MLKKIFSQTLKQLFIVTTLAALILPISVADSVAVTPVSAAELQTSLSGRSWLWKAEGVGAGIYFGPGGQGTVSYRGKVKKIRWYTQNGKVCYSGSGSSCWLVYKVGRDYYSRSARGGQPYKWHPRRSTRKGNHVF